MPGKITNDLHEALVKISINESAPIPDAFVHKLHLMGFIKPDLHHKWLITTDGKAYLNAVEHQNPKE